jgi:prepilin-type N-terminal cleavage/methylation domain-containing protein
MVIATKQTRKHGFTLIEMIGVLAVIAILSALLIPKVFESINNARVNNACVTLSTVKTAVADHFAKYGQIGYDGTTSATLAAPSSDFDKVLLKEAFLDKRFAVKISAIATNNVALLAGQTSATAPDGTNGAFDLDADSSATPANDAGGASAVVVAIMKDVTALDAVELSTRLDGTANSMTAANATSADLEGRVKYATPVNGLCDVYVYITHR